MKYKEPIEISINVRVQPWIAPNFVQCEAPGAEGTMEFQGIPISKVPLDILQKMCDRFRDEVMEKAGYGVNKR